MFSIECTGLERHLTAADTENTERAQSRRWFSLRPLCVLCVCGGESSCIPIRLNEIRSSNTSEERTARACGRFIATESPGGQRYHLLVTPLTQDQDGIRKRAFSSYLLRANQPDRQRPAGRKPARLIRRCNRSRGQTSSARSGSQAPNHHVYWHS